MLLINSCVLEPLLLAEVLLVFVVTCEIFSATSNALSSRLEAGLKQRRSTICLVRFCYLICLTARLRNRGLSATHAAQWSVWVAAAHPVRASGRSSSSGVVCVWGAPFISSNMCMWTGIASSLFPLNGPRFVYVFCLPRLSFYVKLFRGLVHLYEYLERIVLPFLWACWRITYVDIVPYDSCRVLYLRV